MVDAFYNALQAKFSEAKCYDFSINPKNQLSYDRVYERALKEPLNKRLKIDDMKHPKMLAIAIEMMDRNQPVRNGLGVEARTLIINKVYEFWKRFIEENNIDLVFFEEEPHQFFDYTLYMVALELGKQTAWFERTLPQSGLLLKCHNQYLSVDTKYNPQSYISLSGYVEEMKGDYKQVASLMYFDANDTLSRMKK